jgi:hypothetical protein
MAPAHVAARAVDEDKRIAEFRDDLPVRRGDGAHVGDIGGRNERRAPAARIAAAVSSSASTRRPVSATFAPAPAKASAQARPMPLPAPVTQAAPSIVAMFPPSHPAAAPGGL